MQLLCWVVPVRRFVNQMFWIAAVASVLASMLLWLLWKRVFSSCPQICVVMRMHSGYISLAVKEKNVV